MICCCVRSLSRKNCPTSVLVVCGAVLLIVANLHRYTIGHGFEAKAFIEAGVFAFIGHDLDIEIVGVFFQHGANHGAGNAVALVVGMNQDIVDKG